jgi:hypothetical protein
LEVLGTPEVVGDAADFDRAFILVLLVLAGGGVVGAPLQAIAVLEVVLERVFALALICLVFIDNLIELRSELAVSLEEFQIFPYFIFELLAELEVVFDGFAGLLPLAADRGHQVGDLLRLGAGLLFQQLVFLAIEVTLTNKVLDL